jgi:cobalt transporter subunit CbtB
MQGETTMPSGVTARRDMMNTKIETTAKTSTSLMQVLFVAVLGGVILFAAGHAQSGALHDAAHDVRHATGFPCH